MIGNRPAAFADPSGYFTTYWLPTSTRSMQKWEDPELVRLFEDQDQELDPEARVQKLHEIQRYMHGPEVLNAVPIHSESSITLWQQNVRNMYPRLNYGRGSEMIAQIWLEPA